MHYYKPELSFDLYDAGQALYHPNYLVICDRARQAALSDLGYSFNQLWAEGCAFVVRETKGEYFRPAVIDQDIIVTTRLESSSADRMVVVQELLDLKSSENLPAMGYSDVITSGGRRNLLHRLTIQLVFVNLKELKVQPIPEKLNQLLQLT